MKFEIEFHSIFSQIKSIGYRVEAFIEELLADENDASIAQPLILSKKRPRYGLSTIFNQSDSVALHADAQTMPPLNTKISNSNIFPA